MLDYSSLALALLLPWLAGFLCISLLYQTDGAHPMLRAGCGLFVGLALLYLTLKTQHLLAGRITYGTTMLTLFGLTALLALAQIKPGRKQPEAAHSRGDSRPQYWVLLALLAAWVILHLAAVGIEITHRPVYPWDAWLSWMYRAKAWFYMGAFMPMDSPETWQAGAATSLYSVAGNHYPGFVPALATWSAMALGQWSETHVNIPTLFCGIALTAAMYGYCRDARLPRWLSLFSCFILLSTPMVTTHLALAGMADIWMTAFTGLGFVAIIAGLNTGRNGHIVFGLTMVLFSAMVKEEGLVWLCTALLLLTMVRLPRVTLGACGIAMAILSLAWANGGLYLELPVVGSFGVKDGRLFLPFIGDFTLHGNNVLGDYWHNLFVGSSWHLLWPLVILSAISVPGISQPSLRRTVPAFYLSLLLVNLVIFGITEQGLWAEQWTAINRLPMHFAPALVFCLALTAHDYLQRATDCSFKMLARPIAIGAAVTLITWAGMLLTVAPAGNSEDIHFTAEEMRIVSGAGLLRDGVGIINGFQDGIAILSSGPIKLDASESSLARVSTSGHNYGEGRFFWRRADNPGELYSIAIGGRGNRWAELSRSEDWGGQVIEIGLFFEEGWNEPIHFQELVLLPGTIMQKIHLFAQAWSDLPMWSQQSANFLAEGFTTPFLTPVLLMTIWLASTAMLALWINGRTVNAAVPIITCALLAWAILDARWTANLVKQTVSTVGRYSDAQRNYLDLNADRELSALAAEARALVQSTTRPVLVLTADPAMKFEALRMRYHLLPATAHVHWGRPNAANSMDYALAILVTANADPGWIAETPMTSYAKKLEKRMQRQTTIVHQSAAGTLFSFEETDETTEKRRKVQN